MAKKWSSHIPSDLFLLNRNQCSMPNFRVLTSILTDIFNFVTHSGTQSVTEIPEMKSCAPVKITVVENDFFSVSTTKIFSKYQFQLQKHFLDHLQSQKYFSVFCFNHRNNYLYSVNTIGIFFSNLFQPQYYFLLISFNHSIFSRFPILKVP